MTTIPPSIYLDVTQYTAAMYSDECSAFQRSTAVMYNNDGFLQVGSWRTMYTASSNSLYTYIPECVKLSEY
eukprot:scaffold278562_cov33-Prasinocladus_malaysianus.AAC.1